MGGVGEGEGGVGEGATVARSSLTFFYQFFFLNIEAHPYVV